MEHFEAGSRATRVGPASWFTGTVVLDPVVEAPDPARVRASVVTFLPGARTNWHTHPLGQTLHVLSGTGRFQTEGQRPVTIRAGDTIWIAPGEKHWHGAAPETAMTHIAMHEAADGSHIDWLEPVADADYLTEPAA